MSGLSDILIARHGNGPGRNGRDPNDLRSPPTHGCLWRLSGGRYQHLPGSLHPSRWNALPPHRAPPGVMVRLPGVDLMKIQVEIRNVYGNETVYPVCAHAKFLAAMAGTKTLTIEKLRFIMANGYEVDVIGRGGKLIGLGGGR